jgi:hypothetical protein
VASWFTRGTSVFRGVAGETVGYGNVSVLGGTGQRWLRDGGSMPCQRACSAVRGVCWCTGTARALWALWASPTRRSGVARVGVHGRARGLLPRGIDPLRRSKPGDEVTAQEVDSVTLPRFDVLDGHGDAQGRRGVAWTVSARWGRSRVPEEVVIVD